MSALTYSPPDSFWQHFEFKSTLTTALVVSLLTTLISYQLTALLTDLTLGCKPRRKARVHTFHTLLLSRRSSPLAVLNALLRRDAITRLYFRRHLATEPTALPRQGRAIPRDDTPIKIAAVCLLMLLLATPPIVNVFAVGVTIESEEKVSFRQARFGGLRLGVAPIENVYKKERMTEECDSFSVEPLAFDVVVAHVSVCKHFIGPGNNAEGEFEAGIGLLVVDDVRLMVQVSMGTRFWEGYYAGNLKTETSGNMLLMADAGVDEAKGMVKKGMEKIIEVCGGNLSMEDSGEILEGTNVESHKRFVIGWKEVPCKINVEDEWTKAKAVFQAVEEFVTVVRTPKMTVRSPHNEGEAVLLDADDEEFLHRRTRIVGIGVLAVVAAAAVVVRVIVGLVVNNDINDGIERMVKERIGMEYCESLLRGSVGRIIVRYNLRRLDRGENDDNF